MEQKQVHLYKAIKYHVFCGFSCFFPLTPDVQLLFLCDANIKNNCLNVIHRQDQGATNFILKKKKILRDFQYIYLSNPYKKREITTVRNYRSGKREEDTHGIEAMIYFTKSRAETTRERRHSSRL